MTKRQIILLGVILVILALGILVKSWSRSMSDAAGSSQGKGVAVVPFDPAKVERILIGRGLQTPPIELAKENGAWKLKSLWNAKADPVKVENLIQRIGSAQGELRGTGKNLFRDFGIGDEDSFSIKFLGAGNAPFADLRVGTKSAGPDGYFIRKVSSADVYLVDLNMAELLGIYTAFDVAKPSSAFWADLSFFNLDPERVTKITVYHFKGDEKTLVLGLARGANPKDPLKSFWKFLRKDMTSPLDPEKVVRFIATLTSIKAQKVVNPDGKGYGLEKPVWQLAVAEGVKKTILNAGPKDAKEGLYYVKAPSSPSVFSLNATYFDDLNVDDTNFVKDVPAAAEPKKSP